MKEYIEREAAVSEFNRIEKLYQNTYMSNVRAEMVSYCCQVIKHIPAADVVEVRHARWINDCDEYFPDIKCERCGQRKPILLGNFSFNYCPNCGAKMDEMDGGVNDEAD